MTPVVKDPNHICEACGEVRSEHKAVTFECPNGKKTRIGYTRFGPDVFVPSGRMKPSKTNFKL